MRLYTLKGRRFLGLRVGRFYLTLRDNRLMPPLFSERNKIRCRYVTVGNWRLTFRWDGPHMTRQECERILGVER